MAILSKAVAWFEVLPRGTRKTAAERWLSHTGVVAAWAGLSLAFVCAPHSFGASICWWQNTIGVSCPGCGITRSLSCGIRGRFGESLHYHPMGPFILVLFVFIALFSVSPKGLRLKISHFIDRNAQLFNAAYVSFIVVFIGFGIWRAGWESAVRLMRLSHGG